jgi:hypothetical protein
MDVHKADSTRKVAVRVVFSGADYKELKRIAAFERSDVSTLIRRAVARHFFVSSDGNAVKQIQ